MSTNPVNSLVRKNVPHSKTSRPSTENQGDPQRPASPKQRPQIETSHNGDPQSKLNQKPEPQSQPRQIGVGTKKGNRLLKMLRSQKDKLQPDKNQAKRASPDEQKPHPDPATHPDYSSNRQESDNLQTASNRHKKNRTEGVAQSKFGYTENIADATHDVADAAPGRVVNGSPVDKSASFEDEPPSDYLRFIKTPRQKPGHGARKQQDAVPAVKSFFEIREEVSVRGSFVRMGGDK